MPVFLLSCFLKGSTFLSGASSLSVIVTEEKPAHYLDRCEHLSTVVIVTLPHDFLAVL